MSTTTVDQIGSHRSTDSAGRAAARTATAGTAADRRAPAQGASGRPLAGGAAPLAAVEQLNVGFTDGHGVLRPVVRDVSLSIAEGECLAVIGESGSGKSVTARTLIGLTGPNARVSAERLEVHGRSVHGLGDRPWQRIRGKDVGFILQDALVSLDPLRTIGREIGESLRVHGVKDRAQRQRRVIELLDSVGVPQPELRAQQRSGELSGGLRQRALIASAVALDPPLVVADEPTTALDVTVQSQVLDLLARMKDRGTGILLISHDFSVVGRLADRVAVMQGGRILEEGTSAEVLEEPQHEYTQRLLDAVPSGKTKGTLLTPEARERAEVDVAVVPAVPQPEPAPAPLLVADRLTKSFRGPDGVDRAVVSDVSFQVLAGQTLGIVGESGSGKSTTAAMALGLLAPDSGIVTLDGLPWSELTTAQRRPRRRRMTVVYQDPLSSFDPRWNAERILVDALDPGAGISGSGGASVGGASAGGAAAAGSVLHGTEPDGTEPDGTAPRRWRDRRRARADSTQHDRAAELALLVGLHPDHLAKHPLQLSGGQRQRLSIARALAPQPQIVVLDEAVSALDVSVQAQVLDLLTELQQRLGTAYLFISHDLGVIHHMSDRILVMKDGHAVEDGEANRVFHAPEHPYTRQLLASLEVLSPHA